MSKINICSWWLKWGANLAPVQPNSKMFVRGFGVHQCKIKTTDAAGRFWGSDASRCNMAVLGWDGLIILDFDNPDLYIAWAKDHPRESSTYTEKTPRGGYHVFMRGLVPKGLKFREGVELKNTCLVYPSVVDGKQYTRGEGEILDVDSAVALSGLTVAGTQTAYKSLADQARQKSKREKKESIYPGSTVARIKQAYTVTQVFLQCKPGVVLKGHGRYVTSNCPFHQDTKNHFWLDQELNLFGCFVCKETGDVINLYAKLRGITNQEAIGELARGLS